MLPASATSPIVTRYYRRNEYPGSQTEAVCGQEGNLAILDMATLKMATPSLAIIRGMTERADIDRDWRIRNVAESLHDGMLDGLKPSAQALRDAQDYVDGRRTLEELIEAVRRRHTRRPEGES